MLSITLKSPGNFVFNDVPEPELRIGEALIEIKSIGICASDIGPYLGEKLDLWPLPQIQGHEFGGIVKKIKGNTKKIKVGDKVVVFPHINCGKCYYCTHDLSITCVNKQLFGFQIEGGMMEMKAVPIANCVKLNDNFDIRYAGLIEPATVAYQAINEYKNSNIVVVGVGSIGMMMVEIAKSNKNKVIAIDVDENHLKLAKKLGVDFTINSNDNNKNEKIKSFLNEEIIEVIILTFLNQEVLNWAMDIIGRCGIIANITVMSKPILNVDFRLVWQKILTIKGLDSLRFKDFVNTAKMLESSIINSKEIVTKIFPLRQVKEAYEYKIKNNALKVILTN